uniref:Uncharacterized protein n=1 Tax=Magallana gigas TaxID=29159 RepID=K1S6Y0_MAGGI
MQCVSLTAASVLPSLRCLEITQQGVSNMSDWTGIIQTYVVIRKGSTATKPRPVSNDDFVLVDIPKYAGEWPQLCQVPSPPAPPEGMIIVHLPHGAPPLRRVCHPTFPLQDVTTTEARTTPGKAGTTTTGKASARGRHFTSASRGGPARPRGLGAAARPAPQPQRGPAAAAPRRPVWRPPGAAITPQAARKRARHQ